MCLVILMDTSFRKTISSLMFNLGRSNFDILELHLSQCFGIQFYITEVTTKPPKTLGFKF